MKSLIVFFSTVFFVALSYSQTVHYELRMENPANHYFQVDMYLKDYKSKEIEVKLPVWAPGSYLVREFSKNINQVKAVDERGNELSVVKKTKNAWTINRGAAKEVKVSYEVYAFELTVRTSFLDMTHGFVSGTGVFMYTEETRNKPGKLKVIPHASFSKISTAMPLNAGEGVVNDSGAKEYRFDDYDNLADSPLEIGNQEVFSFDAAGVEHTVAMYGWGNYDVEQLKVDMAKVVEASTAIFGQNPNKNYTFIIHNVTDGQGGLEHCNSTTLSVNRYTYQGEEYPGFLQLVAHEYFHLWNVKRLRAIELGPFNYDQEVYTSLLWVMEGFTSYYEKLILLRAGIYDKNQYINKLQSGINYVEGTLGNKVQPVADASFDAWIKAYRPNENSSNTTISYYSKGGIIGALFDAMIIDKFNGKKSLDHFLQLLYAKYYEKLKRGFSAKEFEQEFSQFIGEDMSYFFKNYIYGTKTPDYNAIFSKVGINVEYTGAKSTSLGVSLSQSGGNLIVKSVRTGSAAEQAGLSVNDEIIGCNGMRINKEVLQNIIDEMDVNDVIELLISRDDVLMNLNVGVSEIERPSYRFSAGFGENEVKLRDYWLRSVID
ncbi:MAG: PDZ domain-containing protein [Crocinitomicaceae bacterium]|nr:PDZ domain-containing protein [Crocinitomicaceae bacterium]